jgi:hypothetical protein
MPVKRRKAKVRPGDLAAWETAFISEFDFFGDLEWAGIETDAYGRPSREELAAAWHRLGEAFLDQYNDPHVEPFALREFGMPNTNRRRRACR